MKHSTRTRVLGTLACLVTLASTSSSAMAQGGTAAGTKAPGAPPAAAPASSAADDDDDEPGDAKSAPAPAAAPAAADTTAPPPEDYSSTNVHESPDRRYYFLGARYRGTIIPAFLVGAFADGAPTIYSNTVGLELDMRKDGFSIIPALSYTEFTTDDILFKQKNVPDIPQNYSVVNSGLKGVFATVDLLWSTPISKTVAFEYGGGVGFGMMFGDLKLNWVRRDPNGPYTDSSGNRYAQCEFEGQDGRNSGCNKADHQNAAEAKVGGYVEKSWWGGGSVPSVFPFIAVPQVGLRFKPVKEFESRLGIGFSLTGFWFGLSGNYGFEKPPQATGPAAPPPPVAAPAQ